MRTLEGFFSNLPTALFLFALGFIMTDRELFQLPICFSTKAAYLPRHDYEMIQFDTIRGNGSMRKYPLIYHPPSSFVQNIVRLCI